MGRFLFRFRFLHVADKVGLAGQPSRGVGGTKRAFPFLSLVVLFSFLSWVVMIILYFLQLTKRLHNSATIHGGVAARQFAECPPPSGGQACLGLIAASSKPL